MLIESAQYSWCKWFGVILLHFSKHCRHPHQTLAKNYTDKYVITFNCHLRLIVSYISKESKSNHFSFFLLAHIVPYTILSLLITKSIHLYFSKEGIVNTVNQYKIRFLSFNMPLYGPNMLAGFKQNQCTKTYSTQNTMLYVYKIKFFSVYQHLLLLFLQEEAELGGGGEGGGWALTRTCHSWSNPSSLSDTHCSEEPINSIALYATETQLGSQWIHSGSSWTIMCSVWDHRWVPTLTCK